MAVDDVLTHDSTGVHLTFAPDATRILVTGDLGLDAVDELDAVLSSLPTESAVPVLLRFASTGLDCGATDALRRVLSIRRRLGGCELAAWADEPLVRRGIPVSLLHSTPPRLRNDAEPDGNGAAADWAVAVPTPP